MKIRLMTYNICGGMSYGQDRKRDLHQCAEVISTYKPDILALNEVHFNIGFSGFVEQAKELYNILDFKYMYYGKAGQIHEGYQGNALFSRFPINPVKTVLIDNPEIIEEDIYHEQRSFIDASININGGLRVIVTHFGLAYREREKALELLVPIFKTNREKLVFMGDLNITPTDPQLIRISDFLKDTALISNTENLTFPSDIPDKKIDYIFVSEDIKILSVKVPKTLASDHLPYIADVELWFTKNYIPT